MYGKEFPLAFAFRHISGVRSERSVCILGKLPNTAFSLAQRENVLLLANTSRNSIEMA